MSATTEALAVGTIMPDIPVIDTTGRSSGLHELVAGRKALVYFMRAATCPVCNAHVQSIGKLDVGDTAVVIVTPGAAAEATLVSTRTALTVVASGESGHAEVGLGRFLGLQHSGTFVLDANSRILLARTATVPTGSFAKNEVVALLG